ncbi:DUF1192 domain-containing protein [Microvirga sp. W0021]|uniref:DUF1192 domain-containing protein n=1 Tax=Hohaiivirga grylli TaxID=3133970 RepID=A0ABV0BLW9_9HYPH
MSFDPFDDAPVSRSSAHEIGQDLSSLSVFELEERVEILKREILRLELAVEQKKLNQAAADSFFKK